MVRPHSDWPEESKRYGLGFHLDATGDAVWLEGHDAGVSFSSLHQPSSSITCTVISNCVRRRLADHQAAQRPAWHLNHAPCVSLQSGWQDRRSMTVPLCARLAGSRRVRRYGDALTWSWALRNEEP